MSQQTLRHVFQDVFASGLVRQTLKIAWHAGEPLVLPSSYYTAAFDIIEHLRPSDVAVDHCMQTNGTLIDDAWCEYITQHGIKIGVSIDGPARLHDARRRTRAGAGTHARVMRGIRHLQDHGIQFDVITVLTREALSSPEELFEFYMAAGIKRVGFNIEEIEGCNERSSLNVAEAEAEFRQFLERFWDLVERSGNALRVREFDRILEMIKAPPGTGVENIQVEPFRVLSFDRAGNWSSFSPELLGFPNSQYDNFPSEASAEVSAMRRPWAPWNRPSSSASATKFRLVLRLAPHRVHTLPSAVAARRPISCSRMGASILPKRCFAVCR